MGPLGQIPRLSDSDRSRVDEMINYKQSPEDKTRMDNLMASLYDDTKKVLDIHYANVDRMVIEVVKHRNCRRKKIRGKIKKGKLEKMGYKLIIQESVGTYVTYKGKIISRIVNY
ncbi:MULTISPECIES: hypothetical protein [unclassified Pedobacter]|uniref:hypothetical protein n=1 Tax=unclassified Pedobacter TaxID=2628915 RepID=UPI00141E3BB8|nr:MULTISPECIES: hypothetical protein [unclassified Pedobacter]NII81737.1 hypothetical protein [Pedobacter sp. SG908]NMN35740.1 hypothetical protein [Pedobacter sp. SG918]